MARRVGCGTMTVSRALRGLHHVRGELRERIVKAAQEMGYESNSLVSSVMANMGRARHSTFFGTLGWLNLHGQQGAWRKNPGLKTCWQAAEKRCAELHLALDEIWLADPALTAKSARRMIEARGIIGLVATGGGRPRHHLSLDVAGLATVTIGRQIHRPSFHMVATHTFANAVRALRKLKHMGYERIGLSIIDWIDLSGGGVLSGAYLSFHQSLPAKAKIPILHSKERDPSGTPAFARWLERHRPDCILCVTSDVMANLNALGYRVPEDIGVAHLNLAHDTSGWAGIDTQQQIVGKEAIDLLVQLAQRQEFGIPPHANEVLVKGVWKDGTTVQQKKR